MPHYTEERYVVEYTPCIEENEIDDALRHEAPITRESDALRWARRRFALTRSQVDRLRILGEIQLECRYGHPECCALLSLEIHEITVRTGDMPYAKTPQACPR